MGLSDGEIDLLCIAYPRALSLEVDCFCPDMWRRRCADFLSFDRLRQRVSPVFVPSPTMAAHF